MVGVTASALMGVLEPLLGNLSSMLSQEFASIKDVHSQIESLQDELLSMSATLETMSESDEQSPQTQVWMDQLRELAYDIEDRIEKFMLLGQDNTSDGFIQKFLNMVSSLKKHYDIGKDLKELKARALEVSDRRKRYKMDPSASSSKSNVIDPRLPGLFEEAEKLVGIDTQRDKLVELLTNGNDVCSQKVLSIVGFGGLGKTTLAKQVFNKIKDQFECTAFVSISRNYNFKNILTDVLLQFSESGSFFKADQTPRMMDDLRMRRLEYEQLVQITREHIQNKRYLLVVDDIWTRAAWSRVKCAFPQNGLASRVISTTRMEDVATFCSFPYNEFVYHMKPLDATNSQKLFLARTFKDESDWPDELKQVTFDILRKCEGLPLAIVSIASLLTTKPTSRQDWETVKDNFGLSIERNHELEVIQRILFMSYYDLPPPLKTCCLYLSLFPEDSKIDRSLLIRRWTAEGFILEQRGQSLEDTAQRYFNELVNRNIIQPVDIDYNGTPEACRVHDIMLEMIVSLAAKERFATVMDVKGVSLPKTIRRLSIQGDFWQGGNISTTRSLSSFGSVQLPSLSDLPLLRVLDIESSSSTQNSGYLGSIENLILLRFLRVRDSNIRRLDGDFGRLKLLKTMDLRFTLIDELPTGIIQLKQLLQLFVPFTAKLPRGIGNMGSLEELSILNAIKNIEVLHELEKLENLKDLSIRWNPNDGIIDQETMRRSLIKSFCKLGEHSLKSLFFQGNDLCCMNFLADFLADSWSPPPKYMSRFVMESLVPLFTKLPSWIFSMSELVTLQIWVQNVMVEDMRLLQKLPSLVYLKLDTSESIQETVSISCNGFQRLKVFYFCLMDSFGSLGLKFEAGSAPRIEQICFSLRCHDTVCAHGIDFNTGISHLSTLKHLSVYIYCQNTTSWELEVAESAIRSVEALLPNHPRPNIYRRREDEMVNADGQREGTGV